ncbi:Hypothetical protein FKW44_009738 [Caligus rogercresseyi]|uniref:Uncharacterized protein n=1 Tax=Caligus rogercresseyi TaxID=217165 RepID=A0A7T8K928_CALRO|nr:Hypothetical protein FKW44_009738 [Caligus rogercresseyi]
MEVFKSKVVGLNRIFALISHSKKGHNNRKLRALTRDRLYKVLNIPDDPDMPQYFYDLCSQEESVLDIVVKIGGRFFN